MGNTRPVYSGEVLLDEVRFGVLENLPNIAVASFRLLSERQVFPIYARGISAITMRRYHQALLSERRRDPRTEFLVSVEMDLMATETYLLAFASKIHYHVYGPARTVAESLIAVDKQHLFDGIGLPPDWPVGTPLTQ